SSSRDPAKVASLIRPRRVSPPTYLRYATADPAGTDQYYLSTTNPMNMKRTLLRALPVAAMAFAVNAHAQRYLTEVFTSAHLTVTPNIPFGTNIDFLTSDFSNMALAGPEIVQLQTLVSQQQPIPPAF